MISKMTDLRDTLVARGIKPTHQRLAILGAVLDNRSHPTVKSLHARLLKSVPTLSKTTLYTTLELFSAKSLVASLHIDPSEVRCDGVAAPHHHFLCARCGAIIDLEIICANGERGEIRGHRIDEVHGYFKGVCKDCLKLSYRSRGGATAAPPLRPAGSHHQRRRYHV